MTDRDVRARLDDATREILARTEQTTLPTTPNPAASAGPSPGAQSGGATAYDSALRLLGVRARSRHELRTRLLDKDFEPAEVDSVLDRLAGVGLVDDRDFAHQWVRARHTYSAKGRTALRHELRTKGVDPGIIAEAVGTIDDDDERARAAELLDKKIGRVPIDALDDRAERDRHLRRLVGMLARRGYGPGIAMELVRTALDERRRC
ncbi:regulatory protein RecX [Williamsia sp.]|uniref:regulatory protein RecX n=1 Tax=Williamsia sp. TaxID=1872085 RepID=UPI001A2AA829|nr:regulatory protein RecX [Williamsia sp.]MBJ7290110.1 regulatory protein RecX [Williamsia sp.]